MATSETDVKSFPSLSTFSIRLTKSLHTNMYFKCTVKILRENVLKDKSTSVNKILFNDSAFSIFVYK